MRVVAAGLSHRTAPVAVRERAAIPAAEARNVLRYLVGHSGLSAASVLSTCNRTEFYVVCPTDDLVAEVVPRLARYLDPGGDRAIGEHLEARTDEAAVRHIFRVASGLESMVLGETQILGQMKAAHQIAREAGTLDVQLDHVLRRATSVGKRVRTETGIGRRAGSVCEVAIEYARNTLASLDAAGVLLVGAGKMSRLAAQRLAAEGARLYVTSRGGVSAVALAGELGGVAVGQADVMRIAADVDVVLCSTTSTEPVLTAAEVGALQAERRHRRLCILDIAVPRDVEPEARDVAGVDLVDLDTLGLLVERNLEGRSREVPRAERIIERELIGTVALIGRRDASAPTIRALTHVAEAIRVRETRRTVAQTGELDPRLAAHMDVLTKSIVRKLLHGPISRLRDSGEDPGVALTLRDAFDLDAVVDHATGEHDSDME